MDELLISDSVIILDEKENYQLVDLNGFKIFSTRSRVVMYQDMNFLYEYFDQSTSYSNHKMIIVLKIEKLTAAVEFFNYFFIVSLVD